MNPGEKLFIPSNSLSVINKKLSLRSKSIHIPTYYSEWNTIALVNFKSTFYWHDNDVTKARKKIVWLELSRRTSVNFHPFCHFPLIFFFYISSSVSFREKRHLFSHRLGWLICQTVDIREYPEWPVNFHCFCVYFLSSSIEELNRKVEPRLSQEEGLDKSR